MRRLLFIISLLLFTFCGVSNNLWEMESLSMYSKILNQEVRYSIILPKDYYQGNHSYPVVYLLHGLGDDETSWLEYGRVSQIVDKEIVEGEIIPMIFVMPQGFRTYYVNDYAGKYRYQDMFIQEFIPYIDSHYRTIADSKHRATMGYSMGGFGALILPLKNPNVIETCVPLSISIRTDEQYMMEDSSEWNKQWGNLFGGIGTIGKDRITDYYRQNCPFHIFSQDDLSILKELKIYMDNGDDEHTLCRSNEELHMLLRDKNFSHEFRVRNGGHEFSYWRGALVNGLKFISDSFEGKSYRGDEIIENRQQDILHLSLRTVKINNQSFSIYVPSEYDSTNRRYPVIYVVGGFSEIEKSRIAGLINQNIQDNNLPPMLIVFIANGETGIVDDPFSAMEKELRVRQGYRFRAILGYEQGGSIAFGQGLKPETFAACGIFDASFNMSELQELLGTLNPKSIKRTWFYVEIPDKSNNYRSNGTIHMQFRDQEIYHEYRVSGGVGGFDWFMSRLPEVLYFIANKFHN